MKPVEWRVSYVSGRVHAFVVHCPDSLCGRSSRQVCNPASLIELPPEAGNHPCVDCLDELDLELANEAFERGRVEWEARREAERGAA